MLRVNRDFLNELEVRFKPHDIASLPSNCEILGFGEISTVIGISDSELGAYAVKRIPLFDNEKSAVDYCRFFERYNKLLSEAGLNLPENKGEYVSGRKGKQTVFLAQEKLNPDSLCHRLIHQLPSEESLLLIQKVFHEMKKVWDYKPEGLRLGLDGQLSNWAVKNEISDDFHISAQTQFWYLDTSTPFINENGTELLDKSIFMKSAPIFLRPVLYLLAQGIIERYYKLRSVIVDLLANLIKEKKAELLEGGISIANAFLEKEMSPDDFKPITRKEINKYYSDDKMTWEVYLRFRRFDRWLRTKIFRTGYEFLLPGTIAR